MKKIILILFLALTTISLSAFSYIKWGNSTTTHEGSSCSKMVIADNDLAIIYPEEKEVDIALAIGSRFMSTITKEGLKDIKVFTDFLSKEHTLNVISYKSVVLNIIDDKGKPIKSLEGSTGELSIAQIDLLYSLDYNTNIMIRADFVNKNHETGKLEETYSTPHLTIIPEKQAGYTNSWDEITLYLRKNIKDVAASINEDELEPGKINFTINNKGSISNIKLSSTSGNLSLDKKMIELIGTLPGTWYPAENSKGEKVDQTLVISFGTIGC